MSVLVLQYGARRHYAVPKIFYNAGKLANFYTDVYANQGLLKLLKYIPDKYMNSRFRKMLSRIPEGIDKEFVCGFNSFGIYLNLRWAKAITPTEFTQCYLMMGEGLSKRVIKKGLDNAKAVYGFNGECLELFKYAKDKGVMTILDQTIIPKEIENQILEKEFDKYPDWQQKPEKNYLQDKFIERQHNEWKFADKIICGSGFVKEKIIAFNVNSDKISVVPSGFDSNHNFKRKLNENKKLNILCIGEISLRKGIPYFFEAAKSLSRKMNFRLIGASKLKPQKYDELKSYIEVYQSLPRNEIEKHYYWADIFVLPTLCEGSAMVGYEALRNGLPVITTFNAGSVVRDGIDGFIVPACDTESIINKLLILEQKRTNLFEMSKSAYQRSLEYDLNNYQKRLLDSLKDILN